MVKDIKYVDIRGFDNNQIVVEAQHRGNITFYYTDGLLETRTTLARYVDGRWSYPSKEHMDMLLRTAKQTNKIRRILMEGLDFVKAGDAIPFEAQFKCFRRKFIVRVVRLTNKLKHKI
jgi:hypothetical protein